LGLAAPFLKQRRINTLTGQRRIIRLFGRPAYTRTGVAKAPEQPTEPACAWWNGCRRDLLVIAGVALIAYVAANQFDVAERVHAYATGKELYEIDEILIAAPAVAVALAWFAMRQCRRLQLELARRLNLEQELIASRATALELIENKSAFLANLSHEFRSPLNAIHGFADMMSNEIYRPLANAKYAEYVENIQHGSSILIELVNDVIDLDKIDSGQEALAECPCCVHQTIRDILPIIEPAARSGDIAIVDSVPNGLGKIVADPRALQKIVLNLISDGVKYNRPGSSVTLSAQVDNAGCYILTVNDTGVGIDKSEI